jgi:anti-anti-sigma regulatory factor
VAVQVGADAGDVDAMAPALVLTLDFSVSATSLRCVGTLEGRTRHHMVAAVEQMLRPRPHGVSIDIGELDLADDDAAGALIEVQRMVGDAGAVLRWHGIRADHLRRAPTLGYRSGARPGAATPVPLAAWLPAPNFPWLTPHGPEAA